MFICKMKKIMPQTFGYKTIFCTMHIFYNVQILAEIMSLLIFVGTQASQARRTLQNGQRYMYTNSVFPPTHASIQPDSQTQKENSKSLLMPTLQTT